MKIILPSFIKSILIVLLIVFGNMLIAQSPGGVNNLTSWFKADQGTFTNTHGTTPAVNGNVVLHWKNQQTNANLTHVLAQGTNPTLRIEDPYYNFNDVIGFTDDRFFIGTGRSSVFDPLAGLAVFVLASNRSMPFSFASSSGANSCGANRCNVGFRWNRSELSGPDLPYHANGTTTLSRGNIIGLWGDAGSIQSNTVNGWEATGVNSNTLPLVAFDYRVGSFPGFNFTGTIPEVFTFNKNLTANEVGRIQSYLAIKYGITLLNNGTTLNYIASNSTIVWDEFTNGGFNNDIAGIARDDNSVLNQLKSHSVNNTASVFDDIVTIANGTTFSSPIAIAADQSFLMWGHNDGGLFGTPQSPFFNTVNPETIEVLFDRHWKSQETGAVGTVTLEFDMSAVIGVGGINGANDLNNLRLLVDVDGAFTVGATSITPSFVDNTNDIVQFEHNFNVGTGHYFTVASVNRTTTPLPVALISFDASCENNAVKLKWNTATEINSDYFVIEKSTDALNFYPIAEIQGHGNSTSINNYEWIDDSSNEELGETNYYRLKQVDFNGDFEYFKTMALSCSNLSPINIYPNPINNLLNISFGSGSSDQEYKIEIRDYLGRLIIEHKVRVSGSVYQMKLDELKSEGVYFIKIQDEFNETLLIHKIIKI